MEMTLKDVISLISDAGTSALLVIVLWQGLKRFDMLLTLVITLAAKTKLTPDEVDKIKAEIFNGKSH